MSVNPTQSKRDVWTIYVCPGCGSVSLHPDTHYGGDARTAGEHYTAYCYDKAQVDQWYVDASLVRPFEQITVGRVDA